MKRWKRRLTWAAKKFERMMPPPLLATLLCAVLAGFLTFVPPINGLADNGDYYRAMYSNGIYKLLGTHYNYFDFVTQKYGLMNFHQSISHRNHYLLSWRLA